MRELERGDFILFLDLWRSVKESVPGLDSSEGLPGYDYKLSFSKICELIEGTSDDLSVGAIWKLAYPLGVAASLGEVDVDSLSAFRYVLDAIRQLKFVVMFRNRDVWLKALQIAHDDQRRGGQVYALNFFTREGAVARSLQKLKLLGLVFQIDEFGVNIDTISFETLCIKLERLIEKFGGKNVINHIFYILPRTDCVYLGYFLSGRSASAMPRPQEPKIPWHFIHNLALKHINSTRKCDDIQSAWTNIVELARNIAAVLDVERYSIWEDSRFSVEGLNRAIIDNVIYDELFAFPQWGGDMAIELFGWWIDAMVAEGCTFPLTTPETWRLVSNNILSRASSFELTFRWASDRLGRGIRGDLKSRLLLALSCAATDLNASYKTPFDAKNRNAANFPMIRIDDMQFYVLPRGLAARALYEALFGLMREMGDPELENKLGRALERLTERVLLEAGHSTKFIRCKYKSKVKKATFECDAIVEMENFIFMFECKRKALTRGSRAGNIPQVMIDTSKSFLKTLVQLSRHQLELNLMKKIDFENGNILEWRKRHIEKISIGMLDHGSMQNRVFFSNFVKVLLFANLSSDVDAVNRKLADVNETLSELNVLFKEIADANGQEMGHAIHGLLFETWWFSVDQLANLLSMGLPVWDTLLRVRHMGFGTGDLMTEFHHADRMRRLAEREQQNTDLETSR